MGYDQNHPQVWICPMLPKEFRHLCGIRACATFHPLLSATITFFPVDCQEQGSPAARVLLTRVCTFLEEPLC